VLPGQLGKNGPVWKRQGPLAVGFDRNAIPQDGTKLVQWISFVRRGDQLPLPVSIGNYDTEDRGAIVTGTSGRVGRRSSDAGCRRRREHQRG